MGINRCIVYLQQTPRDSTSGNVLHLLRLAILKKIKKVILGGNNLT
jgi:hypothetical protein